MTSHCDNRPAKPPSMHPTVAPGAQRDAVCDNEAKIGILGEFVDVMGVKPRTRIGAPDTAGTVSAKNGHTPTSVLGSATDQPAAVDATSTGALSRAELKTTTTTRKLGFTHTACTRRFGLTPVVSIYVSTWPSPGNGRTLGATTARTSSHLYRWFWTSPSQFFTPQRYAALVAEVPFPSSIVGGNFQVISAVPAHVQILSTLIVRRFHEHTGIEPVLAEETT